MFEWIKQILAKRSQPRVRPQPIIRVIADGAMLFDTANQKELWRIKWPEVKEIVAWKDDVLAYDIICLGFRTTNEPKYHACDEEQAGWNDLNKAMAAVFSLKHEDWWYDVAYPAFETNWTVLWGEAMNRPCANCGYDLRTSRDRCPECGTPIPPPNRPAPKPKPPATSKP